MQTAMHSALTPCTASTLSNRGWETKGTLLRRLRAEPICGSIPARLEARFCPRRWTSEPSSRPSLKTEAAQVVYEEDPRLTEKSYVTLGLAHCFEETEDGDLMDLILIEPIAANMIECLAATGVATSFRLIVGTTLETALARDKDALPEEFAEGRWCDNYEERLTAVARTWLRPHAQDNLLDLVPLGQVKKFNHNVNPKRIMNMSNEVNDSDNIKQDLSIDVYGRKSDKEEKSEAKQAAVQAVKVTSAGDDLDDLLMS